MSTTTHPTRAKLLRLARKRFNERGLEAVGVRDLARELELSPGNVSYHFPQKEDLVLALMDELHELNNATIASIQEIDTVDGFLRRFHGIFRNQHAYRFLPRSAGTLLKVYKRAARRYRATEARRRAELAATLVRLRDSGELEPSLDDAAIARIVALSSLTARFWLAEYDLREPRIGVDDAVAHYVSLLAHALLPYVGGPARARLDRHLGGVQT